MGKEVVIGIVNYNDEVLIGKKKPDAEGFLRDKWHIPGGALEKSDKDDIGALIMRLEEKIGVKVKVLKYIVSSATPKDTLVRWYECRLQHPWRYGDVRPCNDLEILKWVHRKDVLDYCMEVTHLWPDEVKQYFLE